MTDHTSTTTTTPLIAEDLLLLLFAPASGTFRGEGSPLFHVLAGAVLTELALERHVEINKQSTWRGREARAIAGDGPTDPLLRATWERLVGKPTDVHSLILEIGPYLRTPFIDRLEGRGHVRSEKRRFLGMIPTTALVDGETSRRDELLRAVLPVLLDGAIPDQRTAALVALLSASGVISHLHPEIPWSGAVYTRAKDIQKGNWGADAAGDAVAQTAAAILTNSLFVTLTLPTIQDR